jgi:L-alanine-DL-glutamate epimerase-like enolase superfamily enzyme
VKQPKLSTDVRVIGAELFLLPVETRVPLKFGAETLTSVTCARVRMEVEGRDGQFAEGWGETPLSVQWVWPSDLPYADRYDALLQFTRGLIAKWIQFGEWGHPLEIGDTFNRTRLNSSGLPHLAALVCNSSFDVALHDAYGKLHGVPIYSTYNRRYMSQDLARFLVSDEYDFTGKYPCDFLAANPPQSLPAWHLVGGLDPLSSDELTGNEPNDGHPVLLRDWIARDGLKCLKIKLRGTDAVWDCDRIVRVGKIAIETGVEHLSADFNCTVTNPAYVNDILDRLEVEEPEVFRRILYVEQPFPYELEENPINVHSVSRRKPLFMDESAHDWRLVRRGRELGWTGVALKTCKTQTGAILSLCWAKAHGMQLMVQDLTNPMLAQIPHVLLAAHAETIMGVETNSMQFYPAASDLEARVHPGLYQRRNGQVDLSTICGSGFGYRVEEIGRPLPPASGDE